MEIIILAAGNAAKFFPYDATVPKTLRKAAGKPLLLWNVQALRSMTDAPIRVMARPRDAGAIRAALDGWDEVSVCPVETAGTAETLLLGMGEDEGAEYLVLYGDTVMDPHDLRALLERPSPTALVYPLRESARNHIACALEDGALGRIGAHDRGNAMTHFFAAFRLNGGFRRALERTPSYFPQVKVGVSVPCEPYLEAALLGCGPIWALEGTGWCFDVDKPWHLLEANAFLVALRCGALRENLLSPGSRMDATAQVDGYVSLGRGSVLGKNVRVYGSLVVGEDTVIDNGAVFMGNCVVGDRCTVRNYCQIYDGCAIGDDCIVDHCAELLGGMLMDKVYLYHYGEFYGCIGSYSDLGAGTVCGTLRFDDRDAPQRVNGRREPGEHPFFSATYLGDYVRTGVHTVFMPGAKVGSGSVIGPGVIVEHEVPHGVRLSLRQTLEQDSWGPEQYGW